MESASIAPGFDQYTFVHQALPDLALEEVDASIALLGKRLRAPLIISPMTGGTETAGRINRNLAEAAQAAGIALGVGSQRTAIESPELSASYQVRAVAPDVLLFANLAAVQLNYGYGVAQCRQAVEMIGADALTLHLNPLQEALQEGGNTNFRGLLGKMERVCREMSVPVVVKEVGWGISEAQSRRLAEIGVKGLDVAGAGGTSWSEVERRRAPNSRLARVATAFDSWGIPTAEAIRMARRGAPGLVIIAGGGIRHGVDAAKALALGADAVSVGLPLLRAAAISPEAVLETVEEIVEGLRIAMFCLGVSSIASLKDTPLLRTRAWEEG